VLQEALNNVQQHAEASNVRVRLVGAFPSVILRVEDNGRGFDMVRQRRENAAEAVGHMGLNSMEERIRLVGGTMSIRSAPGEGVRIVFEIPQPKEQV
jgi:signal transduction histidine kinase